LFAAVPVRLAAAAAGIESARAARPSDLSAQESRTQSRTVRRAARRSSTRIIVRPAAPGVRPLEAHPTLHGMRRDCVPTFRERYIPQWGGLVLSASQRCWWVPGP
jgi:hypothetical protein